MFSTKGGGGRRKKKELHKILCETTPTRYHGKHMQYCEDMTCRLCGSSAEKPTHIWSCPENHTWKQWQLIAAKEVAEVVKGDPSELWHLLWGNTEEWQDEVGMWTNDKITEMKQQIAYTLKCKERVVAKAIQQTVSRMSDRAIGHINDWKISPTGDEKETQQEEVLLMLADVWAEAVEQSWWTQKPARRRKWEGKNGKVLSHLVMPPTCV